MCEESSIKRHMHADLKCTGYSQVHVQTLFKGTRRRYFAVHWQASEKQNAHPKVLEAVQLIFQELQDARDGVAVSTNSRTGSLFLHTSKWAQIIEGRTIEFFKSVQATPKAISLDWSVLILSYFTRIRESEPSSFLCGSIMSGSLYAFHKNVSTNHSRSKVFQFGNPATMEKYAGQCTKILSFLYQSVFNLSDQMRFAKQEVIRETFSDLIEHPSMDKLHAVVKTLFFHELDVNGDRSEYVVYQFLCFTSFSPTNGLKNMSLITQTVAKLQYLARIAVMYEINVQKNL